MGLNWRTSAEAQKGSSGQFGDTFEFRPLRQGFRMPDKKDYYFFSGFKKEWTAFITEGVLKNWAVVGQVGCNYLAQQQGSGTTASFVQHNDASQKVPIFPVAKHRRRCACMSTCVRQSFQGGRVDARKQIHIHNSGHISQAI